MNGIIHVLCKILRNVMASAEEAGLDLLFVNTQDAAPIRTRLIQMIHSPTQTSI